MRRRIGHMEPNRYRRQLANMALLATAVAWTSAVLSIFQAWGSLS